MKREMLVNILEHSSGLQSDEDGFTASERYKVTLYLGKPGSGMVVDNIQKMRLHEGYLELSVKEKETTFYLDFDVVYALSEHLYDKAPSHRTGVGFS